MILSGQLLYPFFHCSVGNCMSRLAYGFTCTSATKANQMGRPKARSQDVPDLRSGALCWASLLSYSLVSVNTHWKLRMKSMTTFSLDSVERILMPCRRPPKHTHFKSCFNCVRQGETLSSLMLHPCTLMWRSVTEGVAHCSVLANHGLLPLALSLHPWSWLPWIPFSAALQPFQNCESQGLADSHFQAPRGCDICDWWYRPYAYFYRLFLDHCRMRLHTARVKDLACCPWGRTYILSI